MKIRIYQDYVHNNGLLWQSLQILCPEADIRFVDAFDVTHGALAADIDLFVMPGGADLWYLEKLEGTGNDAIRHYVEGGGVYMGICAGAYYACDALQWAAQDADMAIAGARPLGFIPSTARGPIADFIENGSVRGCWQAVTTLDISGLVGGAAATVPVLYWAGPVFDKLPDNNPDITVLARYDELPDKPPAIVSAKIDQGLCIVCGPHPEVTAEGFANWHYAGMGSFSQARNSVSRQMFDRGVTNRDLFAALIHLVRHHRAK